MISKTRRPIEVLALLLCTTTASAQEIAVPLSRGRHVHPVPSGSPSNVIPGPPSVESCLRQSKSDLSDACRSVFEQSAGPVAIKAK